MNKTTLIQTAASRAGVTYDQASAVTKALLDTIVETISSGERVQISGFGTFEIKTYAARVGHNMNTGEPLQIPERKLPAFKPSRTLKEHFNED